jgi:SAM-dependent methyltransferase|tara:strand:- start:88 stop:633 length:546 start_codon:yes stop_codon:yes gene_type:complete
MNKIKKIMHEMKWGLMVEVYKRFIKKNSKILDVGAGDLYISKLMQERFDSKVVGVDVMGYSTDFIEYHIIKNSKLPFRNNSFDVVTFNTVLHHINFKEQKEILKEARRVGKRIIIFEDNKDFISYFLDLALNRWSMDLPLTHRKVRDWIKLFESLNLKVKHIKVKKPFYYPIRHHIFVAYN